MRILVVDDDVAIIDMIRSGYQRDGHTVATCSSSLDAWDQLGSYPFDLLIADIGPAPQDGLKLLREARRLQPRLTVVAISARPSPYTLPAVLEAGASALVFKPFKMDELRACVTPNDLRPPDASVAPSAPSRRSGPGNRSASSMVSDQYRSRMVADARAVRVLLVEDNALDAELFRFMLRDTAVGIFDVAQVGLLSEAVAHLAANPVDIVLLDLGLPDALGLEGLRRVHSAAPDVPLIVLTGSIDQATAMQALKEGAQDVLIKGVVGDHSLQRVLHYAIERQRSLEEADQIRKQRLEIKDQLQADQLRVRDEFLSHVSHELRTPLAAIHWFTSNLLEGLLGEVNAEQREHLETTVRNANQLSTMLDDLLDSTRANTGKLSISCRELFLDDVVAEALATSLVRATAARVACSQVIPSGLPPAWADPDRTRQVLINLLDNGIRFTPPDGVITVQVRMDDDSNFLRVSVTDSGPGVVPENRVRIFERLFQESNGADSSRKGLGLGLFISRELVTLQGGRIWVAGELGQGATFSFTLPILSLRGLCAPVLTARHLKAGVMTFITVEAFQEGEAAETKAARLREMGRILERCIVTGQDVVLPRMFGPKSTEPFFIVATTDEVGAAVIERRIHQRLAQDMSPQHSKQPPTVSVSLVRWPTFAESDFEQTKTHVVSRLHELVAATIPARR